jgi:negative regulator of sigma E activity
MDDFFVKNRLSAYIDGELPENEMAEVARAIEENEELRAECERMRFAIRLLKEHGPSKAPPGFHAIVMTRTDGLPLPRTWRDVFLTSLMKLPREGMVLAAAAAIVLVVIWRMPEQAPAPPTGDEAAAPTAERAQEELAREVDAPSQKLSQQAALEKALDSSSLPGSAAGRKTPPAEIESLLGLGSRGPSARPEASRTGSPKLGQMRMPTVTPPDEPYEAPWEKEEDLAKRDGVRARISLADPEQGASSGAETLATLAPIAYRLYPTSSDALRAIVTFTERLGGQALGTNGKPLKPFLLSDERNHARMILRIPPGRLDALEPYLKQVGGVSEVSRPLEEMFAGPTVDVEVEILYRP